MIIFLKNNLLMEGLMMQSHGCTYVTNKKDKYIWHLLFRY